MTRGSGRARAISSFLLFSCCLVVFLTLSLTTEARAADLASASLQQPRAEAGEHQVRAEAGKPSREAAGEDETAEFRHSASVKFLAKITGLSLEHAYWLSVVVNFAVIAGLIFWFSRKYLPGMFRSRTAFIQKAMQEARLASEEAKQRLAGIEARLSRLDAEIGQMRAVAEKDARAEEARIQAAAAEDARKVVESVGQEIAAAARAARRELTEYAADLAVSLAKKQIQVAPAADQVLVRDFAQQLAATQPNGAEPSGKGRQ